MSRFAAVVALVAMLLLPTTAEASHVGCGDVISQDTRLDSDLIECDVGVTIGAPNVTLDLAGHTIDGSGFDPFTPGIYSAQLETTIKGGTLTDWGYAVQIEADLATVRHVTTGAVLLNGDDFRFEHNRVLGVSPEDGAMVGSGDRARIVHNRVQIAGAVCSGMLLYVSDSVIAHNVIDGGGCLGQGLSVTGERNVVRNNRVSGFDY
jgi:hypothetical protein